MLKFSLDVLQRCVFPFVHTEDPDVILSATFGEDVALTRVGGDILVSHLDPIVGAIGNIGWLAIEVDASMLPVPPVVSRFAKAFQFDPLWMISSGTLVATIPPERVEGVGQALKEDTGTPFAFVGKVTDGTGVHVRWDGETVHYSDIRCEKDELARMWRLYPREGERIRSVHVLSVAQVRRLVMSLQVWAGGDPSKPLLPDGARATQACFVCHTPQKDQDYTFSTYIP